MLTGSASVAPITESVCGRHLTTAGLITRRM